MKYQSNIRNHYFWDSYEMPDRYETKKMIREYWRTAKEDEEQRKVRRKADTISVLAIFGGMGCLFVMMYMITIENMPAALILLSLFGAAFLINGIVPKSGLVSLDSYFVGLIGGIVVFVISVGIAGWIWFNQGEWAALVNENDGMFRYIFMLFLSIPLFSVVSQIIAFLLAKGICREECSAQCIGYDLKLAKRKKSSSYYLVAAPVFSYNYHGQEYIATDACYTMDFQSLPKNKQYDTIHVNPNKPEIMYYQMDWKRKILPSVVISLIWVLLTWKMMEGKL